MCFDYECTDCDTIKEVWIDRATDPVICTCGAVCNKLLAPIPGRVKGTDTPTEV